MWPRGLFSIHLLTTFTENSFIKSQCHQTLAGLGFLVPYFDLDVIRFGTPPYYCISSNIFSRTTAWDKWNTPDPMPHVRGDILHLDNPDFSPLGPKPRNVVEHYVLASQPSQPTYIPLNQ